MLKGGFASFFIKTYSRLPIYQEIKRVQFQELNQNHFYFKLLA